MSWYAAADRPAIAKYLAETMFRPAYSVGFEAQHILDAHFEEQASDET